jgi:hypothetical protein
MLKDRTLDYRQAHEFVTRTRTARWEGWDIVNFFPNPRAFYRPDGVFDRKTSRWGFEQRSTPKANGTWTVKVRDRKVK